MPTVERLNETLREMGLTPSLYTLEQRQILHRALDRLLRDCQNESICLRESEKHERRRRKVFDHRLCFLRYKVEKLLSDPPNRSKILKRLQRYFDDSVPYVDVDPIPDMDIE